MAWRPNKYGNGAKNSSGDVYLLHFDQPFGHARHYLGFAHLGHLQERLEAHRKGQGSNLIKHVNNAGITWRVAEIWYQVDKRFERKTKNQGGLKKHCPICKKGCTDAR